MTTLHRLIEKIKKKEPNFPKIRSETENSGDLNNFVGSAAKTHLHLLVDEFIQEELRRGIIVVRVGEDGNFPELSYGSCYYKQDGKTVVVVGNSGDQLVVCDEILDIDGEVVIADIKMRSWGKLCNRRSGYFGKQQERKIVLNDLFKGRYNHILAVPSDQAYSRERDNVRIVPLQFRISEFVQEVQKIYEHKHKLEVN